MTLKRETEHVMFELEGDLLVATYKRGARIDLPAAKKIVRDRFDFVNGREVLVLAQSEGPLTMNKEARAFLSSDEAVRELKAAAILSEHPVTAFVGNFIVRVNRPAIPVRIFTSREKAIGWLRSKA